MTEKKKRKGQMDQELPQTLGYEAAGIVDEVGEGVTDVSVGDKIFGVSIYGAAQAEFAILNFYSPIPENISFSQAASLPCAAETAARALDQLNVQSGMILLINGASGNIGSMAVQIAKTRGLRVIGIGSAAKANYLKILGAEPIAYGDGMVGRVKTIAPNGVGYALDIAGNGVLPELIELANGKKNVVTITDWSGAKENDVVFSTGESGRAFYALAVVVELVKKGKFKLPDIQEFALFDIAMAHRTGEAGKAQGKLILTNEIDSIDQ